MFADLINNVKLLLSYLKQQDMTGFSANNGDWVDCKTIKGPVTHMVGVAKANHASNTVTATVINVWEADDSAGTNAQQISGASITLTHLNGAQWTRFEKTKPYLQARLASGGGTATTAAIFAAFSGQADKF